MTALTLSCWPSGFFDEWQATLHCIGNDDMAVGHSSYIQWHAGLDIHWSDDIWTNRNQLFPNIQFCPRELTV
jgi:hypothetical protein